MKDWRLGLAGLTEAQRGEVLRLLAAPAALGAGEDDLRGWGLWHFLRPYLRPTRTQQQAGRYHLADARQRQALRVRMCVRASVASLLVCCA